MYSALDTVSIYVANTLYEYPEDDDGVVIDEKNILKYVIEVTDIVDKCMLFFQEGDHKGMYSAPHNLAVARVVIETYLTYYQLEYLSNGCTIWDTNDTQKVTLIIENDPNYIVYSDIHQNHTIHLAQLIDMLHRDIGSLVTIVSDVSKCDILLPLYWLSGNKEYLILGELYS